MGPAGEARELTRAVLQRVGGHVGFLVPAQHSLGGGEEGDFRNDFAEGLIGGGHADVLTAACVAGKRNHIAKNSHKLCSQIQRRAYALIP